MLMAFSTLIFVVPIAVMFSFIPPGVDSHGNEIARPSAALFLLFPIAYLVVGYIMTLVGCVLYNFISKYIGGIEYESHDSEA